ncbi:MAG: cobalamin-independent methionine synthase II family protein [Candidatus Binataceae bacterium]
MNEIHRAEVIGSLLRPAYLSQARNELEAGTISAGQFREIENRAVDEALLAQERAGVDVVTDGEMRRVIFTQPLSGALDGVAPVGSLTLHWRRKDGEVRKEQESRPPLFAVVEKIKRRQFLARDEFAYARTKTAKPLKVTIPSPSLGIPLWSPRHSRDAYADPLALLSDIVDILREEVRELAALGCKYIQIDAPDLTWLADDARMRELAAIHPRLPEWMRNEGVDAINSIAGFPGVTFGLHMCRGNFQGYWLSEAPWEALSQQVFKRTPKFDILLLEYDDWRSGSFEPLRDIPAGKIAVLGLISTKRNALEPADEITKRIEDASQFYPLDRLALSAQCGFAPEPNGNVVDEAMQAAKLKLVADIAHRLWREK